MNMNAPEMFPKSHDRPSPDRCNKHKIEAIKQKTLFLRALGLVLVRRSESNRHGVAPRDFVSLLYINF